MVLYRGHILQTNAHTHRDIFYVTFPPHCCVIRIGISFSLMCADGVLLLLLAAIYRCRNTSRTVSVLAPSSIKPKASFYVRLKIDNL